MMILEGIRLSTQQQHDGDILIQQKGGHPFDWDKKTKEEKESYLKKEVFSLYEEMKSINPDYKGPVWAHLDWRLGKSLVRPNPVLVTEGI